jgi:glucosamine 6-phosphate synthetase-like amidotransferase/phosphosugar isomerase protein
MCGLIGLIAYDVLATKRLEKVRQEAMIYMASELLQLTQTRGKDATGIVTMFDDCDYHGIKMGVSANEFITRYSDDKDSYTEFLKTWRSKNNARMVLGHCRKPSTGIGFDTINNDNNHPIISGNIIGIHNGSIDNADIVFEKLPDYKRKGKVDSESIFCLLNFT